MAQRPTQTKTSPAAIVKAVTYDESLGALAQFGAVTGRVTLLLAVSVVSREASACGIEMASDRMVLQNGAAPPDAIDNFGSSIARPRPVSNGYLAIP
jgi:hypothetical protein